MELYHAKEVVSGENQEERGGYFLAARFHLTWAASRAAVKVPKRRMAAP